MKALVFHKPHDMRVESVPDPRIIETTDAILRVTSTAICGSDLHIYNGLFPQTRPQTLGHEFMGVIEDVGAEVKKFRPGDRVVVPSAIGCGACWFCQRQLVPACERSNPEYYGPEGGVLKEKGGGLYGSTDLYGGYAGGQAEAVRVAQVDFNARAAKEGLDDEEVLFLSDIFPAGWSAIDWARLKGGETVAVFGCGPVGIMAQKAAWLKGAGRVIGVDIQDYRLRLAAEAGRCQPINAANDDAVKAIREETDGRGADVVVDAVGMAADRNVMEKLSAAVHMQRGTMKVLAAAVSAVRRGGVVSIVGVYGTGYDNFPLGQMFDKGIALRMGQSHAHKYIDALMQLVEQRKVDLRDIVTHRLPLSDGPRAYRMLCDKENECLKVVLKP